ncbi:hypothetical protein ATY81_25150 [Rhizobium sp. R72]|uniref:hypothetical protein n=1 Tax=unclassified Rhizobium TaxID=2613769 RepID=UPI000B530F4D|nr:MULTISPECIES: hypothetical protein [unclassified Rhizobium]OWW00091.1 hypothetical protein ATY81_25150 [Rhizobium sp. R72]OWW00482.1 hypothetical protein ATY80_25150 [Rhizobium sp. R711]
MAGKKTHEQQLRVIEKRVDTANAGKKFDTELDLKKSNAEREREKKSQGLRSHAEVQDKERNMLRGVNQESRHSKHRGS